MIPQREPTACVRAGVCGRGPDFGLLLNSDIRADRYCTKAFRLRMRVNR